MATEHGHSGRLIPPLTIDFFLYEKGVDGKSRKFMNPRWAELFIDVCKEVREITNVQDGTHAERLSDFPAEEQEDGALFLETDRGVIYRAEDDAWLYASGLMHATLANAPTDLGTNDVGFVLHVTDYEHLVRWDGSAWRWMDAGSGHYQEFHSAPEANGWVLSTVAVDTTRLQVGATLTALVVRTRPCAAQFDPDNRVYFRR